MILNDTPTENAYQINNGLGDTLQDRRSEDDILNWFVWLAVCGWILNPNIVGLMILQQQQNHIKLIIR